jgi:hypothetical protein
MSPRTNPLRTVTYLLSPLKTRLLQQLNMPFLVGKLAVYQKALSFAERISSLTADFPRGSWYVADQLNRASLSISRNMAEGNGRAGARHILACPPD